MSVRFDAGRQRWVADYYDQGGKRHAPTFTTRREAQDHAAGIRRALREGTYRDPRTIPALEVVARDWLAQKQDRKPATVAQWETHLERHVLPLIGRARIDRIDVAMVETLRNDLRRGDGRDRRPLAPQTVNKILTTLAAVFKYAGKHRYTATNPAKDADRLHLDGGQVAPGSDGAHAEALRVDPDEILTPEEAVTLCGHAAAGFARAILSAAVMTGLRVGELLALTWDDVTLEGPSPELRVRRSLSHERTRAERESGNATGGRFYTPKSKSSRRNVRLAPELVSELRRWRLACPPSALRLVFPGPAGKPAHRSHVRNVALRPALTAAGLRHVSMHSLRHTFASSLILMGSPVTEAARLLGHSSPAVTLKVYAHWFESIQTDAVQRIGALFTAGRRLDSSKVAAAGGGGATADTLSTR